MRKIVIATARVPGFHNWSGAPLGLEHLRQVHRHEFVFKVGVEVQHDDREVEFQVLQAEVQSIIACKYAAAVGPRELGLGRAFGQRSCEMLAADLCDDLVAVGYAPVFVEVWEDGENGARVEP